MGVEVLWNGALVATVSPTGAWTTRSFMVTGSGGQDRLTIREVSSQSADGLGAMLDNFRLIADGPANAPPVAGNDTATTNEDVAVTVAVLANDSDPEGQTLTVTHINGTAVAVGGSVDIGPASVARNANGTLTVTPDANHNGPVNFTYRVSDGVASADANVAVTVTPLNDAPVVAAPIADQNGVVNQAFSFQVAANAFTDVDNPSLTYSAQLVGGGALPGWLSFTPATRTFSGTPPGTGPLNIAVTASDGTLSATDAFVLNVTAANAPPVAGNDTATTNEDVAVTVAVLANDSDPEGQTLTVTHINGTAVAVGGSVDIGPASVARNANGTLTVTPDANHNGPVNFTYRVSDGVASADANVAVTVTPLNDAPVVAAPIADQNGVVNQAFSFQVAANAFTDVDNPSLTYSAQLVGGGALPGWLSFTPATRTFSGTPPGTGPLNIAVTASDGTLSATDAFVLNVQAAPVGNLLVNGSFEQPSVGVGQFLGATSVPGWTAIPGGTIEIWNAHGGVAATNGTNFLELDYASAFDGFFQDVPTIAGQAYTLQFDTRTRPGFSSNTMGVEVLWNGALVATVSPTGAWTTRSFTVTGSGGQDRLTIREVSSQSADGLGAMLDNFRLIADGPANAPPVAGNDTATTNEDVAVDGCGARQRQRSGRPDADGDAHQWDGGGGRRQRRYRPCKRRAQRQRHADRDAGRQP